MEDYVTFEQAKKLKELGFSWECNHIYKKDFFNQWIFFHCLQDAYGNHNQGEKSEPIFVSAPTLSQAQKWLREVKGIAVCVQSFDSNKDPRYGNFWWKEYFLPNCEERGSQWVEWWISGQHPIFPNYEEALSDGISKMIELIINK